MEENLYNKNKVRVYSGKYLNPFSMSIEDLCILDIAHALAMKPRFNGNTKAFYSIAAHSIWVANDLKKRGYDSVTQFCGLLHDAAEAYLFDIPTPLKGNCTELGSQTLKLQDWLEKSYIHTEYINRCKSAVKESDKSALEIEWSRYMVSEHPVQDGNWRVDKILFLRKFIELVENCMSGQLKIFSNSQYSWLVNLPSNKVDDGLYKTTVYFGHLTKSK